MYPLKISHCRSQSCPAPLQRWVVVTSTTSFLLRVKLQQRAQSLGEGKALKVMGVGNVSNGLSHRLTNANEEPCSSLNPSFPPAPDNSA